MTEAAEVGELFLTFSRERLQLLASRIADCLGRLSEQQIWQRGSEVENSVANLVLHLCGNVRQWIISGVGGQADIRQRDEEFSRKDGVATSDLRELLERTITEALSVIQNVPHHRLSKRYLYRAEIPPCSKLSTWSVEHFGEHTGQIMYMTKQMTHEDLRYHRHLSAQKSSR